MPSTTRTKLTLSIFFVLLAGFLILLPATQVDSWSEDFQSQDEQARQDFNLLAQATKKFSSPLGSPEFWYVLCNKSGTNYRNQNAGRVELGKQLPADVNYLRIRHSNLDGRFTTYESAKSAVNRYCPSWRCNWNGGCVSSGGGGTPENGGCPPGTSPGPWGQCY